MATIVGADVDTLFDLLSLLPPFRGDRDDDGAWDPEAKVPRFWARFIDATGAGNPEPSDPQSFYEGRIHYMESKLVDFSGKVVVPTVAKDAARLASHCLQFFAVAENGEACELLGLHFTPVFSMPDGNVALGRRWADELIAVAWRIYRSVGSPTASGASLVPGRTILPTEKLH